LGRRTKKGLPSKKNTDEGGSDLWAPRDIMKENSWIGKPGKKNRGPPGETWGPGVFARTALKAGGGEGFGIFHPR